MCIFIHVIFQEYREKIVEISEKYLRENSVEIFNEIDTRFLWSNNSHARSKMKLVIKIDGNSITLRLCRR